MVSKRELIERSLAANLLAALDYQRDSEKDVLTFLQGRKVRGCSLIVDDNVRIYFDDDADPLFIKAVHKAFLLTRTQHEPLAHLFTDEYHNSTSEEVAKCL